MVMAANLHRNTRHFIKPHWSQRETQDRQAFAFADDRSYQYSVTYKTTQTIDRDLFSLWIAVTYARDRM